MNAIQSEKNWAKTILHKKANPSKFAFIDERQCLVDENGNLQTLETIMARCEAAIKNFTGKVEAVEITGVGNGIIIAKTDDGEQFEFNHHTGAVKPFQWQAI